MDKQILEAETRKISGRKLKALRAQGILPANVYGKKIKSEALQVSLKEFEKLFSKVGETGLVTLNIKNGKKEEKAVLVSNIQIDPVSDEPIHVDFRQVDLTEKITAEVPVEMIGESPAEKQSLGTVVQYLDEIEVEALPTDLPDKFIIDVATLVEVDQAVFAKDLKVDPKKVSIKVNPEEILVKVEPPQKEEVAPAPAVVEEEAVVEGEAPKEEVVAEGETESANGQQAPQDAKKTE
jgi:large subunit ribosomal protein L25